jgi:Cd2+/Zn2+-exporting ATPase
MNDKPETEHVHGPTCGHDHHHDHHHEPHHREHHHNEGREHGEYENREGDEHKHQDRHARHAHDHDHGHEYATHDHRHAGHVHGPGCSHDHHADTGHVHVHHQGCGHEHVHVERQTYPPANRPAETGGPACQVDLPGLIPGEFDEFGRTEQLERLLEAKPGVLDVHVRRDLGRSEVCVHYDAQHFTFEQIVAEVQHIGSDVAARCLQQTWFVRGMVSAQCGYTIEHALGKKTKGVLSAEVAYAAERLVIEYDSSIISPEQVVARVRALGYQLEEPEHGHACAFHAHGGGLAPKLEMPLVIVAGILIAAGFGFERWGAAVGASTILYACALVSGGFFAVRGALQSLRQGIVDIETLMVLAGVGACFLGAWFEGAFLLFLFSLGHALEHRAMERARRAIEALARLRPETARLKRGDAVVEVAVSEVLRGDLVVVRPGDRLPLDGTIRTGQSSLDQATVTGESVPVSRGPGDEVFASTINIEAVLEIEVTRLSTESVLARIVDMVAEAEAQKSPTQRLAKRLEKKFVPIVLAAAPLLTIALMVAGFGVREAVLRGISLLVAASPCALAISTPAAVLSAVACAARSGVLIKGGAYLEALAKLNAIAFDKTGTLTLGRPRVVTIKPESGVSESDLLFAAACVEAHSSHPIAFAIIEAAKERKVASTNAESCVAVHGRGLCAVAEGKPLWAGSLALYEGERIPERVVKITG